MLNFRKNKSYLPVLIITLGVLIRLWGYWVSPYHYYYRAGDENSSYTHAVRYLIAQDKIENDVPLNELSDQEQREFIFSAPVLGTGSLPGNFHNPLLAYGVKATESVEGALLMMLILHCLTLLFVWWGTRALFDERISLYTLIMSALFFWPVQYAFGIWHPLFIPIFSSLMFFLLASYHRYRQGIWIGLLGLVFTLSFQFHLIHGFLLFFFLFYFWFFVNKKMSFVIWGVAGALVSLGVFFGNYLSYEWEHNFSNALGVHATGYYWEVFKLISNAVIVASAEISRIFYGGWETYLDFYQSYFLSFWMVSPLILVSLLFPFLAYFTLGKETVYRFLQKLREPQSYSSTHSANGSAGELKVNKEERAPSAWQHKKTVLRKWCTQNEALIFIAGWFFIPWIFYFTQLKYHELRFMGLSYPVVFIILAWYLVRLLDTFPRYRTILKRAFWVLVIFQISQSIFLNYYQYKEFERPPHLFYSIRYYNKVANAIVEDLRAHQESSYYISLEPHEDKRSSEWLLKLNEHILITAEWKLRRKVQFDPNSPMQYTFYPKNNNPIKNHQNDLNTKSVDIFSVILYREKKP